jgi:hypothetical protein
MTEYIPFATSEDAARLIQHVYPESDIIRVSLDRVSALLPLRNNSKVWLDAGVDGMHHLESRRSRPDRANSWFELMSGFANFEKIGVPAYQVRPASADVEIFVKAVMDRCVAHKPSWITVPQIPLMSSSDRNKINRALAAATGKWKSNSTYSGKLILPLVFTNQRQINGRTARRPKVEQAERCYHEAQADGFWVVDQSLEDDNGSPTLNRRLPAIIALHEELNESISSKIRIAGPYWGLNLVLWAKGLIDHPAIAIGSGYQYSLAGGPARKPKVRLALPALRRRVGVTPHLRTWLDAALRKLAASHPAYVEFNDIKRQYTTYTQFEAARVQVAGFYKRWIEVIAGVPKPGRSMALFQDLSAAYALGRSLPPLADEGTARRPEAIAEPLMLRCL